MDITGNISLSRLAAQQRAVDVVANNIANANTPGFKAERVQFTDWLTRQSAGGAAPGDRAIAYTQDRATWREQQAGTVTHTGNTFDLALTSDGYFTVRTSNGPRLTRDGRFDLMPDGTISDGAGNAVLDSNGQPIVVSQTDTHVSIAGDGTVSSENGQLGKIGVVRPNDPMQLTAEGNTLFSAATATVAMASPGVVQGSIEESNVQPVLETTRMLDGLRQFQFITQFIQAESDRQQAVIERRLCPDVERHGTTIFAEIAGYGLRFCQSRAT